jgi:hypothetical protein
MCEIETCFSSRIVSCRCCCLTAGVVNFMYFLLPEVFFIFYKTKLVLFGLVGVVLYFYLCYLNIFERNRRFALTLDSDVRGGVIGHS